MPIQIYPTLLFVLCIIGWFGFILTIKLSYELDNHIGKIHKLAITDETISNYLALPLNSGIFKLLKAKYTFFGFYIGICDYLLWNIFLYF